MNNLLNYKQKISRRNKKSSFPKNPKKSAANRISGENIFIQKQSYRPLHKSFGSKKKKSFFSSAPGQYLLLPRQILNNLPSFVMKNDTSIFRLLFKKAVKLINRKILANSLIFIFIFGLMHASSISSAGFILNDAVFFPADSSVESILESFVYSKTGSGEAFGEVDLSLLRGFNIIEYRIQRGDTLSVIANKHKIDIGTLISFNNIKNAKLIQAGSFIRIPDRNGVFYRVQRGDSLGSIALRHNAALNRILDINDLDSEIITPGQELFIPDVRMNSFDLKKALGELFLYPVSGRLTSGYGYRNDPFTGRRRMHYGIDIANAIGTPVKATLDGTVIMCGFSTVYGKYIIIRHQGGYQSLYAHLERYRVKEGDRVSQGQIIGDLGNTGRSTGPHLHFSIYHNQQPVNPMTLLHS